MDTTSYDKIDKQFLQQDHSTAYRQRSLPQLVRSLVIFKACQWPWLVDSSDSILMVVKSLYLSKPAYWFIRHTFFSQFCGGQSTLEVKHVMAQLQASGISSILDYAMESDLSSVDEVDSIVDARADRVVDLIVECIEAASVNSNNFVAVKLTALGNTNALLNVSTALSYVWDAYKHYQKADQVSAFDYQSLLEAMPNYGPEHRYFSGQPVTWNDIQENIDVDNPILLGLVPDSPWCFNKMSSTSNKFRTTLKERDVLEVAKISQRLDTIAKAAQKHNVRIMVDAEQSYFQHAIDYLALKAMKKYNKPNEQIARIYNTYQMYLKDSLLRLTYDLQLSDRGEGFLFAAKVVRGAYLNSERSRSEVLNIRDPVQVSKRDTDQAYDQAIELLLNKNATDMNDKSNKIQRSVSVVVASHNRTSIVKACAWMDHLKVPQNVVYFAQLLGMHNHLSYTLASQGYQVSKYIPFGHVEDVIPYLIRRAQENRSIFENGQGLDDVTLLWKEIRRRCWPF